jgi:NAD(P)-dependent dehydrogenase (short-subunit alcohol dehydrogenase family)
VSNGRVGVGSIAPMRLEGKVAIVTGAGSGIGRAAAVLFAEHGAAVCVADLDDARAAEVASVITNAGGQAVALRCDVAEAEAVGSMVEETYERFGRLDVLYNNAGLWFPAWGNHRPGFTDGPSPLVEENIWDRTLDVNLKGTYLCCRFAIPTMRASGGGAIVNTSSVAALKVGSGTSDAYTASKGGVLAMTRSLAIAHAPDGIRVNCIAPGPVLTPIIGEVTREKEAWMRQWVPLRRWGQPEDIARMALFLASDDASWVTGAVFVVDGGYTAL